MSMHGIECIPRQTRGLLINASSDSEQHVLAALGRSGLLSKAVFDYREFCACGKFELVIKREIAQGKEREVDRLEVWMQGVLHIPMLFIRMWL